MFFNSKSFLFFIVFGFSISILPNSVNGQQINSTAPELKSEGAFKEYSKNWSLKCNLEDFSHFLNSDDMGKFELFVRSVAYWGFKRIEVINPQFVHDLLESNKDRKIRFVCFETEFSPKNLPYPAPSFINVRRQFWEFYNIKNISKQDMPVGINDFNPDFTPIRLSLLGKVPFGNNGDQLALALVLRPRIANQILHSILDVFRAGNLSNRDHDSIAYGENLKPYLAPDIDVLHSCAQQAFWNGYFIFQRKNVGRSPLINSNEACMTCARAKFSKSYSPFSGATLSNDSQDLSRAKQVCQSVDDKSLEIKLRD